jgi:hypothetical protein
MCFVVSNKLEVLGIGERGKHIIYANSSSYSTLPRHLLIEESPGETM